MIVEEIVPGKNGRVVVYTDSGVSFPVYKRELQLYDIEEDKEISQENYERIRAEVLDNRAKNRAMHLIVKMDRTECQLRRKLKENSYPDDVIDEAVNYVKAFSYVDDYRYSCSYIRSGCAGKSRLKLKTELAKKGVSSDVINSAMEEEYVNDEYDIILKYLEKKGYDQQNLDVQETAKIYRSLIRKGFEADTVRRAMKL